jgi:hypothetical protein
LIFRTLLQGTERDENRSSQSQKIDGRIERLEAELTYMTGDLMGNLRNKRQERRSTT